MKHLLRLLPKAIVALVLCCAAGNTLMAQDTSESTMAIGAAPQWEIGGYLKDLQYIQFTDIKGQWTLNNIIHNRFDVHWYPSEEWKFNLGLRNRLIYGESVQAFEQNTSLLNSANGLAPLGGIITQGQSYLLHSIIDRAYIDYKKDQTEISLGRQRINWGLNLVWNPNDIFNAYSYFDFDYEERPGTDAVRVQYYTGNTSSIEVAYKPGKTLDSTIAAGLYRTTIGSYDVQALAGIMDSDYAIGAGWSGVFIGGSGFSGEATAFTPRYGANLQQTIISASTELSYTFPNSLALRVAYLFNSGGSLKPNGLQFNPTISQVTANALSPARHSLFADAAYTFTPLITGDLAGIINPADGSFYVGPSFTFSITNDISFLFGGELFFGGSNTLYGDYGKLIFLRLKWSF
jgi:hypothetical protein